ncbi:MULTISPECIES: putative holin-like toxin [Lachnospiraceae]|uniref:putative holin-like toxin n=1 Tax=Lachnospiraceae TaxID=186803 RepID=UPI0038BCAC69
MIVIRLIRFLLSLSHVFILVKLLIPVAIILQLSSCFNSYSFTTFVVALITLVIHLIRMNNKK